MYFYFGVLMYFRSGVDTRPSQSLPTKLSTARRDDVDPDFSPLTVTCSSAYPKENFLWRAGEPLRALRRAALNLGTDYVLI
jgi:hypothetical protein